MTKKNFQIYLLPPLIGLMYVLAVVPFNYRPDFSFSIYGSALPIHHLLYFSFGLVALFSVRNEFFLEFKSNKFLWILTALLGSLLVSSLLTAHDKSESFRSTMGFLLRGIAPGLLTYWLVKSERKENAIVRALVGFAFLLSLGALYEVLSGKYFLFERVDAVFTPGMGFPAGAIGQPLPLSVCLMTIVPLVIYCVFGDFKRNIFCYFSLCVICLTIFLAFRRSAYVLVVLTFFLSNGMMRLSLKKRILFLLTLIVLAAGVFQFKFARRKFLVRFEAQSTIREIKENRRPNAFNSSLSMALRSPVFGVGSRQYRNAFKEHAEFEVTSTPDSQYLRALSENGFLGLSVFVGFFLFILFRMFSARAKPVVSAIFLGLLNLSLAMVINDSLYWPAIQYSAWVVIGLGMGLADRDVVLESNN